MSVYKAINAVQSALCKDGIAKNSKNVQQGYNFRGIDDFYNTLAPLLSVNGLCILPRCVERDCVERVTQKGNALFYVTVKCEFDFVASDDGSKHTVTMYGEAMDSGDKATNKAMSAAYKYACMQAFSIPIEGDSDADSATHRVAATPAQNPLIDRWVATIKLCTTIEELESQGKKLAASTVGANDRAKIKPVYSARMTELKGQKCES